MLLVSIAVVSFVLVFLSRNLKESGGARLAGNTVTVSAMSFPVREGEGEMAAA
jgi:hypothetical protein